MEKNKTSLNHMYHVVIVVWLVRKLNDFIQLYLCNWMTFYLTSILHQPLLVTGLFPNWIACLKGNVSFTDFAMIYTHTFDTQNASNVYNFRPINCWYKKEAFTSLVWNQWSAGRGSVGVGGGGGGGAGKGGRGWHRNVQDRTPSCLTP